MPVSVDIGFNEVIFCAKIAAKNFQLTKDQK